MESLYGNPMKTQSCLSGWLLIWAFAALVPRAATAQIAIQPPYHTNYSLLDLGSVPGVPSSYGGLTVKADDPQTLLIGGAANGAAGKLYAIRVVRGTNNHITGFTGTATIFAEA